MEQGAVASGLTSGGNTMAIWQITLVVVCAIALLGLLWARANEKKKTA
jgi:hypothetical protein